MLYQQKKGLSEEKLFSVVPPGIEPRTQGQRFLTLSPLLYQQKKGLSEEKLFSVVPPGIEPRTQGQRFLTLSPLLYQQKKSLSEEKLFLKWCHQESNRGHKDFQSFALPTELWHQCLQIC